jgi:hypothetical protein
MQELDFNPQDGRLEPRAARLTVRRSLPAPAVIFAAAALALAASGRPAAADPATACAPAETAWARAASTGDASTMRVAIRAIPSVCTQLLGRARARYASAEADTRRATRVERPRVAAAPEPEPEPAPAPRRVEQTGSLANDLDLMGAVLSSQGSVAWEKFFHDADPGAKTADWNEQQAVDITAPRSDVGACTFHFHYHVVQNGSVISDLDSWIPFKTVVAIKVTSESDLQQIGDARRGHSTYSNRVQPAIYDVEVVESAGGPADFPFYSLEAAQHVGELFENAARDCGVTAISHY